MDKGTANRGTRAYSLFLYSLQSTVMVDMAYAVPRVVIEVDTITIDVTHWVVRFRFHLAPTAIYREAYSNVQYNSEVVRFHSCITKPRLNMCACYVGISVRYRNENSAHTIVYCHLGILDIR